MLTGYVVDFEVMSKVCRHCSVAKNKLGQSSAEFSIWYEGHKSECEINHLGSSTSMEMEAALTLWKRSTSLGFRYITVLSDGDCKTFNYLCEKKVYGPDIVIKKEECINHVSKRLGTALRSTVKDCRAQDAKPQHSKCPAGENSWCFYQSAIANGEKPNNHKLNVGTPINEKFLPKILPIYQRLASNELLERCIRCGTQNANESLHSMIWAKCPKEIFVNKRRVKRAVTEAVCEYNKGTVRTIVETQKALGVATGGSTKQLATILDCRKQKFRKRRQNATEVRLRSQVFQGDNPELAHASLQTSPPCPREDFEPRRFIVHHFLDMFTYRNCGCGDRGRVAIYRPFGEFRRAKIVLSPVWCSRPTTGVPLAHVTMNFVGIDLTTSDRTATAGSDVVQSGRPIFDDFFQHLWPYIGNNPANAVYQMVKRLWLIRIDQ
ncbi:uncharacterized protein TNCV_3459781 [Trichonephila clavipes]|nr:uncharacterized protein TNCV_3459781 [Trichonephila clavipes]